ncbi:DUF6783 domain-containing protein [Blautia sp.]
MQIAGMIFQTRSSPTAV